MKPGSKRGPLPEETREKLRRALSGVDRGGKRPRKPRRPAPAFKMCIKCHIEQPLDQFRRNKFMADGYLNCCRSCDRKWIRENRIKRWGSLLNARRVGYARELEAGSRRRVAPQKYGRDPIARRIALSRYGHKRRTKTRLNTEFDEFVFAEAVRLRISRDTVTNIRWSVDHIVPLNHRIVSGLHNGFNLQVAPRRWNELKKNLNTTPFFPVKNQETARAG